MNTTLKELTELFEEAKQKNEFEFVLTIMNYKGIGEMELMANLHEWFDAIEFYKTQYYSLEGKQKVRIGTLLYSTFFENSDFYNIIGSVCRIKLGYKGSSRLFWKTKKYERLLGIGEKQDFLIELLDDVRKQSIIDFFNQNHFKEIRNTFFHSAYSLTETEYILHDSEPIYISNVGHSYVSIQDFLIPKIENVIEFFDKFKNLYVSSFASYTSDKEVNGRFPAPVVATIIGSSNGLKGFIIKNAVTFYGQSHDSGIWYNEAYKMWEGHNITTYINSIETIEIREQLQRYFNKEDIRKSDKDFFNMIDKVKERNVPQELQAAVQLLIKFGNIRYDKMDSEQILPKKKSLKYITLPFYEKALEMSGTSFDKTGLNKKVKLLKEE